MSESLKQKIDDRTAVIGIIGMGYVGLPLAAEFGKIFPTIGFDINAGRIDELKAGSDHTLECSPEQLAAAEKLAFSTKHETLNACDVYIITVPTPIDQHKTPDLQPLLGASATVGKALSPGNLVIYESTVYPGCTEEDCVPVLERESGLRFLSEAGDQKSSAQTLKPKTLNLNLEATGFYAGYSPERINPGDKEHTVSKILKITSGSTPGAAEAVDALYRSIITAGTHLAPSLKVAEAAKVIENSQRDINIAFVNELGMIFHRMGIDTTAVLEAAGTKWNFLPFRPGLVGGHCIGVDPYYLTQRAKHFGYHPEIILAGRRLNDNMGKEVAGRVIKMMIQNGHRIKGSKVLVLGITFKENCPDIRNSRVIDVIRELQDFDCEVMVHDPWADAEAVKREYGIALTTSPLSQSINDPDAIVVAVAHHAFKAYDFAKFNKDGCVIFDLKGVLPEGVADARL